jgi:hypothetical protein
MKTIPQSIRTCGAIAIFVASGLSNGFSQSQATTDPVGFIDLSVLGGGTTSSPKYSLISPTLTQPVSWQGQIIAVSTTSSHTTITVSGVQFANNQFNAASGAHYVEIISTATPANTGVLGAISATVAGTTNSSITTSDNLAGLCAVGDTIRIRKEVTIGDVFGTTNVAGLLSSDDPATADEVLVYDGASSTAYFYYKVSQAGSDPSDGWYDSGFSLGQGAAAKVVVGPHQGLVIKRKAAGAITFTMSGAVKTGNTLFPVVNGINVLGTASAMGLTLGTSGLFTGNSSTGLKSSDDPSSADEVTIYTAGGQTNYFYYKVSPTGSDPSDGWYDSGFAGGAANVVIAPGSAFVVNRKGGPSFNWVLPSPTSF